MQLLATEGTEGSLQGSSSRGLNLIPGRVVRLNVGHLVFLMWDGMHCTGKGLQACFSMILLRGHVFCS